MVNPTFGILNDTAIPIQVQLLRDATPLPLGGISASAIRFRFLVGGTIVADVPAETIDDASAGKVSVTPPVGVRDVVRTYTVTVFVTFTDGTTQTFPAGVENRYIHKILAAG